MRRELTTARENISKLSAERDALAERVQKMVESLQKMVIVDMSNRTYSCSVRSVSYSSRRMSVKPKSPPERKLREGRESRRHRERRFEQLTGMPTCLWACLLTAELQLTLTKPSAHPDETRGDSLSRGDSMSRTRIPSRSAEVTTHGFQGLEVKTNHPWTYQTDLFVWFVRHSSCTAVWYWQLVQLTAGFRTQPFSCESQYNSQTPRCIRFRRPGTGIVAASPLNWSARMDVGGNSGS